MNLEKIDYTKYPVPRIRHHANSVFYFPLKQHKNRNFRYPPLVDKFNWNEVFSDGKPPLMLDVGCGMGKFLIETALHNTGKNILGFELRVNAVEWINRVIDGEKIQNSRALWYSVVNGFPFIESCSVEKIFYLFPDPWVKKRHHKRRAFNIELLDEFYRILKHDGILYIMTDVPEVDKHHRETLDEHKKFVYEYVSDKDWNLEIKTNQEDFCIAKEIPFTRMICVKKSS
jgi:tRNA (guanine-N7-)-methyltransferase